MPLFKRIASLIYGPTTYNENGDDTDFRLEGDTDANLFFLDASTDRIGIGTSSPQQKLHVNGRIRLDASEDYEIYAGNVASDDRLVFVNIGGSDARYWYDSSGGNTGFSIAENGTERAYLGTDAGDFQFLTYSTFGIKFRTQGGRNVFKFDTDGNAVFNDEGNSVDWRAEGDTDANLFFLDGSADLVGIGTSSPNSKLTVNGDLSVVDGMTAPSATVGYAKIYVDTSDGDLKVIFGDGTIKTLATDS